MKKLNLLLFFLLTTSPIMWSQSFQWAFGMGTPVQDEGRALITDADNNIYSVGRFRGSADFDPGEGIIELTSDNNDEIYVQKVNSLGELVWAKQLGGTSWDVPHDMAIDGSGNVYIVGSFSGTADFDPDPVNTNEMTSYGIDDAFVCKLNSDGNFVWALQFGGEQTDECIAIDIDPSGYVYTTGRFQTIADFQPGEGSAIMNASGFLDDEIFLCKHTWDGDLVWAKQMGGSLNEQPTDICVNDADKIFLTGLYYGSGDYDTGSGTATLIAQGYSDGFIACYNSDGNYQWAHTIGSNGYDIGHAVVCDADASVYVASRFESTIDADLGTGELNLTAALQDIAIMKLDVGGNFIWAKQLGGSGADMPQSLAMDDMGFIYCTGYFQGTADFDGGTSTQNLTSAGGDDIFLCKLNPDGATTWCGSMGSPDAMFGDVGKDVTIDNAGDIILTGWFYDTTDFDPSDAIDSLVVSQGSFDAFVLKLDQPDVSVSEDVVWSFEVFPNPTSDGVSWNVPMFQGSGLMSIYNAQGQLVCSQNIISGYPTITLPSASGMYTLRMTDQRGNVWLSGVERR